jgi:hypothetical protein
MGKHPQNRFRRLVIVGSTDKKQHQPGPRWWGPRRTGGARINQETQTNQASRAQFRALRMAVMPTLSRGLWLVVIAWLVNFVRGYFVTRKRPERGAVVLPFRRSAAMAPHFHPPLVEEGFVSKKANGSVRWNSDREVAPLEGGRG